MNKERVIVFDGEDKFIAPRNRTYDAKKGISKSKEQVSKEGERFKAFMLKQSTPVVIPSVTEEDFCKKIAVFIKTNGDGRATPEMVMDALKLFQDNCIEKPKEKEAAQTGEQTREVISDEPSGTPVALVFPDWNSLSCEQIDTEIASLQQTLMVSRFTPDVRSQYEAAIAAGAAVKATKCAINPPALPDVPPTGGGGGGATVTPVVLPPTGVSLSTPALGKPPKSGAPSGGGGEEKKDEPKKGSNWLMWVILGGVAIYFLTRKKN